MPAVIFITKVRVENLPATAQGTPGLFRVKFRAGSEGRAPAETVPKPADPDGSVEWLEALDITVYDTSFPLIAVVQQTNYLGGWSLVPDGRFEGAAVSELPNEWRHASSIPTAPTFYAQLSVHVEEGTQRNTRLPPFAGMDKPAGGGGFRGGPVGGGGGRFGRGGRGGRSDFFHPRGSRGGRGAAGDYYPGGDGGSGWGAGRGGGSWAGHAGTPQMARVGGSFSGLSASSGSIGYGSAVGSPEVYGDARGGWWGSTGGGGGGGALIDRSSSGASSAGSGMPTAIAEPAFPFEPAPPGARGRHSSMTVPSAPRVPVSMRRHQSAGFVPRESSSHSSRDGSRRFSLGAADMPSVGEAPVVLGASLDGLESEPIPPASDGRLHSPVGSYAPSGLRSPVGTYVPSPLLDMSRELEEEVGRAPGAGQQQEEKREDGFRAAFKGPSKSDMLKPSLRSWAKETRETEEGMEEVKTERRSGEDVEPYAEATAAAPSAAAPATPVSRKRIFPFPKPMGWSRGSRGPSAAGSSSTLESELQPSRRKSEAAPPTASSPLAEEKEEGRDEGEEAPSGAKKSLRMLAVAGKLYSRKKKAKGMREVRAMPMRGAARPPPPPLVRPQLMATPPAGAAPSGAAPSGAAPSGAAPSGAAPPAPLAVPRRRVSRGGGPPDGSRGPEELGWVSTASSTIGTGRRPRVGMMRSSETRSPAARAPVESSRTRGESTLPPPPPLTPPPTYSDALRLRGSLQSTETFICPPPEGPPPEGPPPEAPELPESWRTSSYSQPLEGAPPLPDRREAVAEAEAAASARRLDAALAAAMGGMERHQRRADFAADVSDDGVAYDTGMALGTGRALGTEIPPRGFYTPTERAEDHRMDDGDEEESIPSGYSTMPQDSLGVIDPPSEGRNGRRPLYPVVRPRGQLGPSDSMTTMTSEAILGDDRSSLRLIAQSTTASSRSTTRSVMNGDTPVDHSTRGVILPGRDPVASSWFAPPPRDPVIFSCFAPSAVTPGIAFDLTVKAFLRAAREAVMREAMAEGAAEAGRPGGMKVSKGTRMTVELNLPEHAFKMLQPVNSSNGPAFVERLSVSDFTWTGETTGATFRAACIPGTPPGRVQCGAKIIEGRRVTHLSFGIEVAELGATPRALLCERNVELHTVMKEVTDNVAEVPFGELEFVKELGQGVQGKTSHYRWRGNDVAVKSLSSHPCFFPSMAPARSGLEHEATILSIIGHHPNIVRFFGLSRRDGACGDEEIHIVTKLEEGGSMEGVLGVRAGRANGWNGGGVEFDGSTREVWAGDIARGLANSHAAGVLHNDIASRNALLSRAGIGGRGLLCDFGISRFLREEGIAQSFLIDPEDHDNVWPLRQMPPESLVHPFPLTAESDAWMYGLFLYEVFEGQEPWAGLEKSEVKRLILEGKSAPKVPEMLRQRGDRLVKLYESCLSEDSTKRPSLERIVDQFSPTLAPSDWMA
ncbi:unnamed protein product [Ectocarpus sp. CCAP 1310/34]|nr:unnamed protein product [Ectocarpus sp. CCAP 1310/34]